MTGRCGGWRSGTPRITFTWSPRWPARTGSGRKCGTTFSGCGKPARTSSGSSGCARLPRRIAPRRGGRPGLSRSRRSRRGWAEPPRVTLRREVCTAAAGASTEEEFFACLAKAGVLVRRRHSTINPLEVTGYAVGLPNHIAKDGQIIWYGGGKLAADLTLPKLRARWDSPPGGDRLAAASSLPAPAARAVLRATVATEAEQAGSETEFFTRLRAAGVLVRERFSTINPGEVTGYAVALPGCTGSDGTPRWYGGGRLHDSLTLPRLRTGWARRAGAGGTFRSVPVHCAGTHRDLPGCCPAYRRRDGTRAPLHRGDPHRGADTAWAAADTLHAAARALRSPMLRCAAAGYDRAARAPFGRPPPRTGEGDQLRSAARLLAMTGSTPGDGSGEAGALIANLVQLLEVVSGLREAQAHAAQAAAAREAAEQLHATFSQARGMSPNPGHVRASRPGPAERGETHLRTPPGQGLHSSAELGSAAPGSRTRPGRPPRVRPTR